LVRRHKTKLIVLVVLMTTASIPFGWADAQPDKADPALYMGDLYAGKRAFDKAITEYKRVLFFNRDEGIASSVHAKIAACYQAQQRWPEAIFHLRRSIQTAVSLQEIEDREFDLIAALLASGRDNEAELHLLRLREYSELDARRVSLYLCISQTYRGHWEKAAEELRRAFPAGEIADEQTLEQIEKLELLFAEAQSTPRKSPNGAAWLSTAVPGAGQLYAGEPWDGLNAFVVNAGLATLIFAAVKQEWYLEGVLLFLYPLRRYYLGNRDNAKLAAERSNLTVDDQYRQQILEGIASLLEAEDVRQPEGLRTLSRLDSQGE
jgi:tetratricopeptide (TPR) repeat protein